MSPTVKESAQRRIRTRLNGSISDMPRVSGRNDSKWILQSLQRDDTSKLYKLVVAEDGGQLKYALNVDADTNDIKKADPVP